MSPDTSTVPQQPSVPSQPPVQDGLPVPPPSPSPTPPRMTSPTGPRRRLTGWQWALIGLGVVVVVALVVGIGAAATRQNTSAPTPTAAHQPTQAPVPTATTQPGPSATSQPAAKAAISEVTRSVTAVQNSPDTQEITATATCAAGTTLIGGGYRLQPTSNTQLIFVRASYPSAANAWTVIESNPQSGGEVTVTAAAICLTTSVPITVTPVSATVSGGGAGVSTCPASSILTGGGFKQAEMGANVVDASSPSGTGSGWRVSTISEVPSPFTVYALCATTSGLAAAEITTATAAIANNTEGTAASSCKPGRLLIGGGYSFIKGDGYFLSKEVSVSEGAASWAVTAYNLYSWTGAGPTPTPPPPMQVTAYAICVTSA